jgi:DNA-binding PadR family transcriptional regulator
MQEIAERTGGVWTPSPGSVYPALQQLQDEGLVSVEANADGRNIASLTAAGETYMGEHGEEMQAAFQAAQDSGSGAQRDNVAQFKGLVRAFKQVLEVGTPAQIVQATAVLEEAQRKLYAVLAQAPTSSPEAD